MKLFIAIVDYSYAALMKVASCFYTPSISEPKANAKTVIIIPGVYETPLYVNALSEVLKKNCNVIHAYSIYGKGSDIDTNAHLIAQFIDECKLIDVILIGHSSGGLIAVKALSYSKEIAKVIAIAAPFHGVLNGHLLRTSLVRELLPGTRTIKSFTNLSHSSLRKITSLYPSFDNQIWSKEGSYLNGAENIQINAKGHHLILRSSELLKTILQVM